MEVVAVASLLVVVAADSAAVAVAPSTAAVVPVRGRGGQRCWWVWVGRLVSLVVLNCCTTATAVIVGGGGAGSRASSTASPGTTVVGIVVRGKPPPLPPVISIIVRRIACEKNEKNGWEKGREGQKEFKVRATTTHHLRACTRTVQPVTCNARQCGQQAARKGGLACKRKEVRRSTC